MAKPKKYTGEKLLVQIGDGNVSPGPEVFAHDCLINTERGVEYQTQTQEEYLPDCEDLDAIPDRTVEVTGKGVVITGSGIMHSSSWDEWFAWWKSGANKTVRVKENIPAADGGGTEEGQYKLTALSRTGAYKQNVTVSLTLTSDGEVTRAPNAA